MTDPESFVDDAFHALTREGRKFYVKATGAGFVGVLRRRDGKGTEHTTETAPSYQVAVEELYGAHLVAGLVDKVFADSPHAQALKQLLR